MLKHYIEIYEIEAVAKRAFQETRLMVRGKKLHGWRSIIIS